MMPMEAVMKNHIILLFSFLLILSGCASVDKSFKVYKNIDDGFAQHNENKLKIEEIVLPKSFILEVPFVMQAPFANWSEHNESCEEAGILLAHYYYTSNILTKELADHEIKDMVKFQKENYGGEYDIYADEMADLASEYYGIYRPRVFVATQELMKKELVAGNPIIVPTTAAYLKKEKGDYPEMGYHVVVVVGYNDYGFITHDVGTYSGEDFTYSYSTLLSSMEDYEKRVLVLI